MNNQHTTPKETTLEPPVDCRSGSIDCSSVSERPIIFSDPLIRAILRDEKTETRRVITPQPKQCRPAQVHGEKTGDWFAEELERHRDRLFRARWKCPYGKPGWHLWVRECWAYAADNPVMGSEGEVAYRATDAGWDSCEGFRWRPSIHMPRWASRINLLVRDISVERLHEITEEAAKAEGVDAIPDAPAALSQRTSFARLWDKINAKRGYGWDSDPWVWVVRFQLIR